MKFQIEVPVVATRIYYLEEEDVNTIEEAMQAFLDGDYELELDEEWEYHNESFLTENQEAAVIFNITNVGAQHVT